ncbi:MAG: hypothetical protein H6Q80_393, partial [Deltaproteobacteria bacterium]|nr:hypothetical protein [Deltaproteobacteria bacterium]
AKRLYFSSLILFVLVWKFCMQTYCGSALKNTHQDVLPCAGRSLRLHLGGYAMHYGTVRHIADDQGSCADH